MELIELIDNYLIRRDEKDRDMNKFHISELGYGKRALYERFKDPSKKEKPKPQLMRVFENGHFVHQRYYKYFAEMGILRAVEIKAIDDDVFSGTADCIISDKSGVPWVVDVKSCNSWVFMKLEDMKPEHKIQILFYMYFLRIDQGMVLYENKDNQNIKVFKVIMDNNNREMVEKMADEFRELKKKIDSGVEVEFDDEDEEVILTVPPADMEKLTLGDLVYGTN